MTASTSNTATSGASGAGGGAGSGRDPVTVLDVLDDVLAGVLGAVGGLAGGALGYLSQRWLDDRPRRQVKRTWRRRRWRYSRTWRRQAVRAEMVFVVAWLVVRSLTRLITGSGSVWRAAADGWQSGQQQARTHRADYRAWVRSRQGQSQPAPSGQGDEDAQVPPSGGGWWTAPAAGWESGQDQGRTRAHPGWEDGPVIVGQVICAWVEADGRVCGQDVPDGELFCLHHGQPAPVPVSAGGPSRRWDREPETAADRRFFDLRESGYDGWIDRDGYPVPDGYAPAADDLDPANAAVPCPACGGVGCETCGNGFVPAWAADPSYGVIPAGATATPATPQITGASPAPALAVVTAATGRNHPAMPTTTAAPGQIATDLQNVDDLRIETDKVIVLIEEFEELGRKLRQWTDTLPDRYQAAPFGTKSLAQAVQGVSEHGGRSGALREQIEVLRRACAKALQLGDHISGLQAEGETAGYTPR